MSCNLSCKSRARTILCIVAAIFYVYYPIPLLPLNKKKMKKK